jgi:hypothetical protein
MDDPNQVDPPEGWISLSDAVEHFVELSSELLPLDRSPFDGNPWDAGDEMSASIVRSYALRECERLIDRSYWGVFTSAGSVVPMIDRDPIRHGLFDLEMGVLGRTLDRPGLRYGMGEALANILTDAPADVRTQASELPADLERYRDCHVVLHAEAWRDVVHAWRADWVAERSLKLNEPIDFSGVSDEWLGRKFSTWKRLGLEHGFTVVKKADNPDSKHAVLNILRALDVGDSFGDATLSENRFDEIWRFEARKPENWHLRMASPGAPKKQPKH